MPPAQVHTAPTGAFLACRLERARLCCVKSRAGLNTGYWRKVFNALTRQMAAGPPLH